MYSEQEQISSKHPIFIVEADGLKTSCLRSDNIIVIDTGIDSQAHSKNISIKPIQVERSHNPEVLFSRDKEATIARDFVQLKLKKESKLPITLNDIKEETQIQKIIVFFKANPIVGLNNFKQAESVLCDYLNDPIVVSDKLAKLQEAFDKETYNTDKFGKVIMSWALKDRGVRLKILRSKLKDCSQSIAVNFKTKIDPALVVYTDWDWKNKKTELIRSKSNYKHTQRRDMNSINFDAAVWQAFNPGGLLQKNYMKSLDCIERNYLDLSKFVHEVNKKCLMNLLSDNLMNNIAIKTDNQETTFLSFTSNAGQKVEAKVTSFASSLLVYR